MNTKERYVAYAAAALGALVSRGVSTIGGAPDTVAQAHKIANEMVSQEPDWVRDLSKLGTDPASPTAV